MEEIMKDARKQKKTAHITFFDLEDVFGSVPHSLIMESLKMNFVPQNIIDYFSQLYSSCQAVVQTLSWRSDLFYFLKTLHQLDKLMRKDMKKSVLMNNLNSLAWYGSYQIWLTRNDPVFTIPAFLIPHLGDLPATT